MSDTPQAAPSLTDALQARDADGLRTAAAAATTTRKIVAALEELVDTDVETLAPGLLTDLFERGLREAARRTKFDSALLQLARRARPPALAAATRLHAEGQDGPLVSRLALEAAARGAGTGAAEIGLKLLETRPITQHHIIVGKQLRIMGHGETVKAWIAKVEASGDLDEANPRLVARFRLMADHVPTGADISSVVLIREKPGARRVVFAFFGLSDKFNVPLERLEEWMAPLDAHLVMLKDPELLIYLKGIAAIGSDLRATAAGLCDIATRLGAEEILCMGTSAGGFAAIRYGLLTGASRVLGFGALTTLTVERTERRADGRAPGLAERLVTEVRHELGDAREWLGERTPPMPLDLYYGDAMPNDRFHAEHVGDVPGVTLHPIPGLAVHGLVHDLARMGRMPGILEAFVQGRPLPDVA